ncbi:MAG: hypothetical protein AAB363_09070 [Planctomycetota bacterium]
MQDERRKRIPELKAESRQIRDKANEFMADAHAANAKLNAETHQFLTDAHAANDVLKAHVRRFRADVNRMVGEFAQVSHERAAAWKQTLNAVRGRKPSRAHPGASGRRG